MSETPSEIHARHRDAFAQEAARFEGKDRSLSLARLVVFFVAVILTGIAVKESSLPYGCGAASAGVLFAVLITIHLRVVALRDAALLRRDVHTRHIARIERRWADLPPTTASVPANHPYALDIDLTGPRSLLQRIDVTHTRLGEEALIAWLGAPADRATILERQRAVEELSRNVGLRRELEVAAIRAAERGKLDPEPLEAFTRHPSFFASRRWLVPVIHALPVVTLGLMVLNTSGLMPNSVWLFFFVAQTALFALTHRACSTAFAIASARKGFAEAFVGMLRLVEAETFEAPHLRALQERMRMEGHAPSAHMRTLERWTGLAELRTQFLLHVPVNLFSLWDLHVLYRLERWNEHIGKRSRVFFEVVGDIEALSCLATLRHDDRAALFPEILEEPSFAASSIAHPLLDPERRVANDLAVPGPGRAIIVTGSNMAGKSTLLRTVGLNLALAFAGGPVCATTMRTGVFRLRASMRVQDSLQEGASYFHAELTKLRTVLADLEEKPPVFFLIDELLRGTGAHARHLGGSAVLKHLLARGAMGLVATHDLALSKLEAELPNRIENAHFTDVVEAGVMLFDYKLRPGVVKTSNALALLRLAGIEVDEQED